MYEWTESDEYEAENDHGKMTLGHRIAADKQRALDKANQTIASLRTEILNLRAHGTVKPLSGMRLYSLSVKRPWCDVEFGRAVIEEFCRANQLRLDDSEDQSSNGES